MEHRARYERFTLAGFAVITLAGLAAFLGTYWDDAWHTDFGRDDFFIPPHMVLYAGVAVMGAVATLWALATWYETRSMRAVWANPALRLGVLGVAATLAAAPIDEFWHVAFGRDAVVWSPPHMLGFAALFALATGFLLEAARIPGRWGAVLTIAMAAFLVGAVHVPVMEYESDVPQFAVLWYLPVLTAGTALAFAIIETRRRVAWGITAAALAYTGVRVGIVGFLAALEHSLIFVPPIVLPALAFEITGRRGWSLGARALAHAAAMYAVYTPFLALAQGGVRLEAADLLLGAPLAGAAAWAVLAGFRTSAPRPAPRHAVAVLIALALVPSEARAHDPGQGTVVGEARFLAVEEGGVVGIDVEIVPEPGGGCSDFEPRRLVARRAGVTLDAELAMTAACRYAGRIALPGRGRWFVYAEMTRAGRPVEAWIPVIAPAGGARAERTSDIYVPPARADGFSLLQLLAGVVLYALCLLFIAIAIRAARRAPAFSGSGGSGDGVVPAPREPATPGPRLAAARTGAVLTLLAGAGLAGPLSGQCAAQAGPADPGIEVREEEEVEEERAGAAHGVAGERRHVLIPRPLLFYTEEMGWAGGADIFHSYRQGGSGTHPTMSHLYVLYTSEGKVMASVSTDRYTDGNRYRFGGHAMYMHYPQTFYGIGRDLPMDDGEAYTSRSVALSLSARRRFGPALVAGGGWSGERYSMTRRDPDGRLADGTITGADGGLVSALSLHLGADTRAGVPAPFGGSYAVVNVRGSHPITGSDFRFARIDVDARRYFGLPAGQVFAVQAVANTTLGDAPFQVLPRMGGDDIMRGYSPMFNRDRHMAAAQIEHRVPIWWRVGAVGFAGAGAIGPRIAALDMDAVRLSYGGGLRFAIHRVQRLNARVDWGLGSAGSMLHVGVGEAF